MALLDQLFGQQQPQGDGGLIQSILSQRFAPQPQDAAQATYQTLTSPQPVNSYTTQAQRMQVPMGMAGQLGNLQEQGEKTQALNLQNQVTQFQMPFLQKAMGDMYTGASGGTNGYPVGFPQEDPRLKEAHIAAMIGNKSLADIDLQRYQADPSTITAKKRAEETGTNQAAAEKGVVGIDSRLQNAINILDEQIKLAPQTFSGKIGEMQEGSERNLANFGANFSGPTAQTKFAQNNANLFTQELPAIMSGMPGSRMDIPLINAIKNASSISEYGTPQEKIESAQNLKKLLAKYQQNTHNYAAQMGAGNTPIPNVSDENPPGQQPGTTGLDESDPRIQAARSHGYSDDEIQQYLMKGHP